MQALLQNELLNHPAIEAGIVPFIIALIAGAILPRRYAWWSTVIFAIAYFFAAWLILDGRLTPLSSSRKLVLMGAGAVVLGIITQISFSSATLQKILVALAIIAATWLIWPKLTRLDITQQLIMGTGVAVYAIWLSFAFYQLRDEDIASSMSATILGFATGICALIGASSLLGELGIAIGASTIAVALHGLNRRIDHSAGFYFSVSILCTLIGIASVLYAKVPWHSLIALASIPLVAMLFEWRYRTGWIRIVKLGILLLIPAGIAIFITEQAAGPIPF